MDQTSDAEGQYAARGAEHGAHEETGFYEPLPAALPAVREWSGVLFGLGGLAALAGAAAQVAVRLGLAEGLPAVAQLADKLTGAGATPALCGATGAILLGFAAGARGRRLQARRTLDALGQSPDYGAWLEDLDEGLQRMHVSLVTVESHVAGAVQHTGADLAARLDAIGSTQRTDAELGARLMRVESTVGRLAACVERLQESVSDRSSTDEALARLSERVGTLARAVEREVAERDSKGAEAEQRLPAPPTEPVLADVDEPAAAIPTASGETEAETLEDECSVEGLPLFAAVDEPRTREGARTGQRRNPYER